MSDLRIQLRNANKRFGEDQSDSRIHLRNVYKRFGEREILAGISLTLKPGETVTILGPSGGGKSTLLRCLNGLNVFDEGEIQVGPHVIRPGKNGHKAMCELRRYFG